MNTTCCYYFLCLCWWVLSPNGLWSQACVDITVSLEADGHYTLLEKDAVQPFYQTEEHISISRNQFTCDDIGSHAVDVLIYTALDDYIHCTTTVTVKDATPPVSKCFENYHVELNGQGEHVFTLQDINRQSTDACGNVGVLFFPDRVTCADNSPLDVLVVARDESGNKDTCYMEVTWEPFPGMVDPIACRDSVIFKMQWGMEIMMTPEMVLDDIVYGCPNEYVIQLAEGANIRPVPLVTFADSNASLQVTITDTVNLIQCTAPVKVLVNISCEKPVIICDVECHTAAPGDCDSGHSLYDEIEWPCDIVITGVCPFDEIYPDAINLEWYGLANANDIHPELGFWNCLFTGHFDQVHEFPAYKLIQRNWTVLNWGDHETYEYVQNITLEYDLTEICDTKPWSDPVTDCSGGHSPEDDVEWPADITIHTVFASPEQLEKYNNADPKNIRPQLFTGCNKAEATCHDQVTAVNATQLLILRTWVVQDLQSLQTWEYVQRITILRDGPGSMVCVTREHGQAIPHVELVPDSLTDATGCFYFENPEGVIVTPAKNTALSDGVNVNDQVAIREYLLGIRGLSVYERYAADVTQDGVVDEGDLHAIEAIINGTFVPPFAHTWVFFEKETLAQSIDISNTATPYYFIGVKIGDVIIADGEEEIYLVAADEVLNQGETYEIDFYLDRNEITTGMGLRFESPGNRVEFLSLEAPQLPDFGTFNYFISDDFLSIVWLAQGQHMENGVPVAKDQPLFTVQLHANENTVLQEAISLSPLLLPEFIRPHDPHLMIRLLWDDGIESSTLDLPDGRTLVFYPNPADQELYMEGLSDGEAAWVSIYNPVCQVIARVPWQHSIDVSTLPEGAYYVSVMVGGIQSKAVPFIKIQ